MRTLQRRGQDWYCGSCGPRAEPCAGSGRVGRSVSATAADARTVRLSTRRQRCRPHRNRRRDRHRARCRTGGRNHHRRGAHRRTARRAASASGLGRWPTGPSCSPEPVPTHRARGAAAERRAHRCRRPRRGPPSLPTLRPGDRAGQTTRRAAALPQLHGQVPRRNLLAQPSADRMTRVIQSAAEVDRVADTAQWAHRRCFRCRCRCQGARGDSWCLDSRKESSA